MAIKYVPYYPDTLEGQAILDNFVRTQRILRYRDNDKIVERIERGMPLYEVETQEIVGNNPNHNMVIRGECLSACAYLKDKDIKIDLVYIDPPFASGADYAKKIYVRRNPKVAEVIRQAETEVDSDELRTFEEKMYGDVWDKERYLNWMYENLMAIKSVMSDTASIWVELDSHIGHYVKILLDEIFGEQNFINEVIWKRTFSHSDVGQGAKHLGRLHDVIFLYSRSEEYIMNTIYTPYTEDYIKNFYKYKDKDGRKYRLVSLLGPGGSSKGNPYYKVMGISKYWAFSKDSMRKMIDEGLIVQTKKGGVPQKKRYLNESQGVPLQDIWTDIAAVQGGANENAGYATQKPEALLERIIKTSSNEGMLVADFFGGSGVTATVASKLGRRFIHCDIGINSIETTRDRLIKAKAEFQVMEIKDGVSLYRNPVQTMDKLKSLIPGLRNEDKLDKFWEGSINDTKHGMVPVYLPNLLDSSTRLLDKALMNRIIREEMPDLPDGTKKVIVYYIDIIDEKDIKQFIKEQNDTMIEIELRDLKNVLDNVVVEDEAVFDLKQVQLQGECFKVWQVTINSFFSDRVNKKIEEFNLKGQQQAIKGKKAFKPITISNEGLETIEFISLDCSSSDLKAPWHSNSEILIDKLGFVRKNGVDTKVFWDGTIASEDKPLRLKIRNICGDETIYSLVSNSRG
jgi:adenine-specific DNA-methyltransferase